VKRERRNRTDRDATDIRSNLDFRYYQTGSPFEYELVRLLYTKVRKVEIAK